MNRYVLNAIWMGFCILLISNSWCRPGEPMNAHEGAVQGYGHQWDFRMLPDYSGYLLLMDEREIFRFQALKGEIIPVNQGVVFSVHRVEQQGQSQCWRTRIYKFEVAKQSVVPLLDDGKLHRMRSYHPERDSVIVVNAPCDFEYVKNRKYVERNLVELSLIDGKQKHIANLEGYNEPVTEWDSVGNTLYILGSVDRAEGGLFAFDARQGSMTELLPQGSFVNAIHPLDNDAVLASAQIPTEDGFRTGIWEVDSDGNDITLLVPGVTVAGEFRFDASTGEIQYDYALSGAPNEPRTAKLALKSLREGKAMEDPVALPREPSESESHGFEETKITF